MHGSVIQRSNGDTGYSHSLKAVTEARTEVPRVDPLCRGPVRQIDGLISSWIEIEDNNNSNKLVILMKGKVLMMVIILDLSSVVPWFRGLSARADRP
jgi:hypothetical protein